MFIQLTSPDQHSFACYLATPVGATKGAVVVLQEIFGVNEHIRSVCERYAAEGYVALAPALFDRIRPGVELGYGPEDRAEAVALAFKQLTIEQALMDIQTAVDHAAERARVGVVGYCFGGLLAWLSACQLGRIDAVSAYYGGGIARYKDAVPRCPVQLHFGKEDALIPLADVEAMRAAHPAVEVFLYDAGHGFNCDQRESFHAHAAAQALTRTLEFFGRNLKS
ncbi:MAG TPA: dienelactone hydrolase family protein [Pseudomonadales bacterium]|nr:dienelactone hydrolase family protein [Pseudomonadales bacterium]